MIFQNKTSLFKFQKKEIIKFLLIWIVIFSSITFLLKLLFERFGLEVIAYSKDFLMLAICAMSIKMILLKRNKRFAIQPLDLLLICFIFICIFYTVLSPISLGMRIKLFWAIVFGPVLFLALKNIPLDNQVLYKLLKGIFLWLLFLTITAIIIYLVDQEAFINVIGLKEYLEVNWGWQQVGVLYRSKGGHIIARMTGLLLSPLDMAFSLFFLLGFAFMLFRNRKHQIAILLLWLLAAILCDTRSLWVGLSLSICALYWAGLSNVKKIFSSLFIILIIVILSSYVFTKIKEQSVSSNIMGSASISGMTHMYDLFVRGPELMVKYWYGAGIGTTSGRITSDNQPENFIGNIESFYYSLSVQIGVLGLLLYCGIVYHVLRRIIQDRKFVREHVKGIQYNLFYNSCFVMVIGVHIGVIFLPVLDSKITQSLLWVTIYTAMIAKKHIIEKGMLFVKTVA